MTEVPFEYTYFQKVQQKSQNYIIYTLNLYVFMFLCMYMHREISVKK